MVKTQKRGKQHQNSKKINKREQEDRTRNTEHSQYTPKQNKQCSRQKEQQTARNGELLAEKILPQQESA